MKKKKDKAKIDLDSISPGKYDKVLVIREASQQEENIYNKFSGVWTQLPLANEEQVHAWFQKELEKQSEKVRHLREKTKQLEYYNEKRKELAGKIELTTNIWLGGVAFIVLWHLIPALKGLGSLPEGVMITLLGATTVKVVGLYWLIIKELFPGKGGEAK